MAPRGSLLLALSAACGGLRAARGIPVGSTIPEMTPTEMPGPGFPGATAELSNQAWPSRLQPQRLSTWPQTGFGTPNASFQACWKNIVIHDTINGWPGLCLGLVRAVRLTTQEQCRIFCFQADARCSVWQFNNQTTPNQCWVGYGTDCDYRAGAQTVVVVQRSQRVMHGDVHVLMNLTGWKIHNLYQLGDFHRGNTQLSVERCKGWCYSSISCEYWQYSATGGGCFVDAPMLSTNKGEYMDRIVQYPLTTNGGATQDSNIAYGEYIQHYCPPQQPVASVPVVAPTTPVVVVRNDSGGAWWNSWAIWGLMLLAATLAVMACVYGVMLQAGPGHPKGDSKRNRFNKEYSPDGCYEEDKPLMMNTPKPPPTPGSEGSYGQGGFDKPAPPTGQQPQGRGPYGPGPGYNQGYNQGYGRGSGPAQGGAASMPPPTQLLDFGQQLGQMPQGARPSQASMPTQMLPPGGMPFPSRPGYPSPYQPQTSARLM